MPNIIEGAVYFISNRQAPDKYITFNPDQQIHVVLKPKSTDATFLSQLWRLYRKDNDTWAIYNLATSDRCFDMYQIRDVPGTMTMCWYWNAGPNQLFQMNPVENANDTYFIHNRSLNLDLGEKFPVVSNTPKDVDSQKWVLQRASLDAAEIHKLLLSANDTEPLHFPHFPLLSNFFPLPQSMWNTVHGKDVKGRYIIRKGNTQSDAPAFAMKVAANDWCNKYMGVENLSILCGILYCKHNGEICASNWSVSETLDKIVFFDPVAGQWVDSFEAHDLTFGCF